MFAMVMADDGDHSVPNKAGKKGVRTVLAHEGHQSTVAAPDDIFDRGAINLRYGLLLLNIIQHNGRC